MHPLKWITMHMLFYLNDATTVPLSIFPTFYTHITTITSPRSSKSTSHIGSGCKPCASTSILVITFRMCAHASASCQLLSELWCCWCAIVRQAEECSCSTGCHPHWPIPTCASRHAAPYHLCYNNLQNPIFPTTRTHPSMRKHLQHSMQRPCLSWV